MHVPTEDQLAKRIERFCERHEMAVTRFGREATGNPNLLKEMKDGKSPSLRTVQKVVAFMAQIDAAADLDAAADAARRCA